MYIQCFNFYPIQLSYICNINIVGLNNMSEGTLNYQAFFDKGAIK